MGGSGVLFGAVGDIVLCGRTARAMERFGISWPFEAMAEVLGRPDLLFGNLECALLPSDFPTAEIDPRGLTTTIDGARALGEAGFDVINLANNHILDGGTIGMLHTAAALDRHGVGHAGVGATQEEARAPLLLERNGLRWAFLCYSEDSNLTLSTAGPSHAYYDPDGVIADVARVRSGADVVVVSIHADLEFTETPSPGRRSAFRRIAEAGATLVLGHHAHVPQGMERVGSSLVVHSLGNFVSHAHTSPYLGPRLPATAQSFVLLAEVGAEGVGDVSRVPVTIGPPPDERPRPATGRVASELEAVFAHLDQALLDDAVVAANWRRVALEQAQMVAYRLGRVDDVETLVHGIGTLLHVAKNRTWVDEVVAASRERWEEQRAWSDPYHRPCFATQPPPPRGLEAQRAAVARRVRAAARAARRVARRVRARL